MSTQQLEFSYHGNPVGFFEEDEFPKSAGKYRYMPYRGFGHYEMQTALQSGERPRCTYKVGGRTFSFVVVDCHVGRHQSGVLEVADITSEDAP